MSLGESVAAELPRWRAEAESLMVDVCVVQRGPILSSDDFGADVITYTETVYEGPCKVQDRDLSPQQAESGSSTADVLRSSVHVPVGTGPFVAGDVVFVGDDVTPSWRVLAPHNKTWQTAQRLPVERVS